MIVVRKYRSARTGGIYVVVLGTSMIVAVLGLAAMLAHRIQNRVLTASADVRQAQLNAHTAVELALLTTRENNGWRTQLDASSYLFSNKSTGTGSTCSLKVTDALADPATATADKPITLLGIGYHGVAAGGAPRTTAAQRVEATVDPRRVPHDFLKQGSAATPVWQTIFDYYSGLPTSVNGVGTKIEPTSLPDRTPNFSRNPSLNDGQIYWTGNLPDGMSSFRDADDVTVGPYKSHSACLWVERNDWREGAANRLNVSLLKPDTSYDVSIEINPDFTNIFQLTRFRISLIAEFSDGTTAVSSNSIVRELRANIIGASWTDPPITGTLRTPVWTQQPITVYLVVNSNDSGGTHKDFFIDNFDVYESGARFIYQKVLSPSVNNLYTNAPTNASEGKSHGIYWINCQGTTKLIIERSRVFGTLFILNPGPESRIDYGPINMSPALPGYPALIVSNAGGNMFAIRATPDPTSNPVDDDLTEAENGVNYNPTGAPHRTLGTNSNQTDIYDSDIRGLVIVSGNLTYANNPTIRGRVLVGGTVTGSPTFTYRPDALLNPPPPLGGFYTYRYDRRPASTRKAVQ